ncbi:MAG: ribosome assembly factor SBDS [Thermoplasmata archaeon]|nr:ribosome assembly factor SBDS [Thermoplasmata archaeon]
MDGMVIARLESHGHDFEIILEADYVNDGKAEGWSEILEHMPAEEIFIDARKGERVPAENMNEAFATESVKEIAINILKSGNVQLTTEQRRQMQDEKRKQVIAIIVREAMNPQTKTPHPPQRIENAMNEAGVHIDPMKPVAVQVKEVVELLRPLLPISFEKLKLAIKLNGDDYGKCYGDIKGMSKITKEEWTSDGSWVGVVDIPAGLQEELFRKLNEKTKGNVETKMLK